MAVAADPASLASAAFPERLIAAWADPSLNLLQTSPSMIWVAGKTMVGDLAALRHVIGRWLAPFLFPLKALVAVKKRHVEAVYGALASMTVRRSCAADTTSAFSRTSRRHSHGRCVRAPVLTRASPAYHRPSQVHYLYSIGDPLDVSSKPDAS